MPANQINEFMDAISGIESGGDYDARNPESGAHGRFQVMPQNWQPWAREAGLGSDAPRTPTNQERVARHKMLDYYRQFGSWDATAVAWFAGPGRARDYLRNPNSDRWRRMSDGHTTVADYVGRVQSRLSRVPGGSPSSRRGAGPGSVEGVRGGPPSSRRGAGPEPGPGGPESMGGGTFTSAPTVEGFASRDYFDPLDATVDRADQIPTPAFLETAFDEISRSIAGGEPQRAEREDPAGVDWAIDAPTDDTAQDVFELNRDLQSAVHPELPGEAEAEGEVEAVGQAMAEAGGTESGLVVPVQGVSIDDVADTFGAPRSGDREHAGIDIMAPTGTPALAATGGRVVRAGDDGGAGGNRVWIQGADGNAHYYAHLDTIDVFAGDTVEAGQAVGTVGKTGNAANTPPHLHYSINRSVGPENPVGNPMDLLKGGS